MSDSMVWILYGVIVIVGFLATVLYWVGRYFFNTDDEEASMTLGEEAKAKEADQQEHD